MFPEGFVAEHVQAWSDEGDIVLDPFSGRGTTLLQSLLMRRKAVATDINPVAYCISAAKAAPPVKQALLGRLHELKAAFGGYSGDIADLPDFFDWAFSREVLAQLLFLRSNLRWRTSALDNFLAALVLGSLHGEMDKSTSYFSNQMPRTISTKPAYSVKYWRKHKLFPPARDVFSILEKRIELRYSAAMPEEKGLVALTDARLCSDCFPAFEDKVRLVVTSPPYFNVTNYEEDQWLRLWFLGNEAFPTYRRVSRDDRHSSADNYWHFLTDVWEGMAPLLRKGAVLVCRIAGKGITRKDLTAHLVDTVETAFPHAYLLEKPRISKIRNKQTATFQPNGRGCFFEVDHIFRLS